MSKKSSLQYWAVWYPILLHAAPDVITVEVFDERGHRLAYGKDLERTQNSPICRICRDGSTVLREDTWPVQADIGSVVMLPGGEVGLLKSWWHAEDRQEWRWQVEFYNSLRPSPEATNKRIAAKG
jgi:hypothetical protein